MRKRAVIVTVLLSLALSDMFPKERKDDSYIIRKAYIDILGTFPTAEEIDWYCVYNTDSYEKAVDYLANKTAKDPVDLKVWLLSDEYQKEEKIPLATEQLDGAIAYFTGNQYMNTPEAKKKNRLTFIEMAKIEATSDTDVLDNMANLLMSRTTSKDEANRLVSCLNAARKNQSEEAAWMTALEALLAIDDVKNK